MSLPTDPRSMLPPGPHADPHADLLVASAVRAAAAAPAADCPDAELLALYAERALSTSDLAQVQPHLDGCPRCQAIVAACVRALPERPETSFASGGALATGRSWFSGWRWLVPITSVAAVALVAVWIGRRPSDQAAEQAAEQAVAQGRSAELAREAAPTVAPAPTVAEGPAASLVAPPAPARRLDSGRDMAAQARQLSPRAEGKAEADRQAFAAPAELASSDERLGALKEEARAKATAAESARNVGQLADAAAAAPPPPAPAAVAPAAAASAPASPAPAPPATAGRAANAVGGARAREAVMATLTGTVTYRARVALPAGAVIEVRLLDVSRADAPADTLARAEIVTRGEQVPVAFTLSYDRDVIQARRRYVVQATIAIEGRVTWRTTTQHPVFVAGAAPTAPVTVVVEQIR